MTERFIAKANLTSEQREFLLSRFRPSFPLVHCRQVTLAYAVARDFELPLRPITVTVYGYHRGRFAEGLAVMIDQEWLSRSDGKPYFICLSHAMGRSPVEASEFDPPMSPTLPEFYEFELQAVLEPLQVNRAELRQVA